MARPMLLNTRSSTWFIITVVAFADAVDIFMYSMVAPVMPTALRDRVGVAAEDVQKWTGIIISCFAGGLLLGSPVIGALSDHFESRRVPFIAGLTCLALSTAMLCIGSHLWLWVLGRFCQGASAAAVWVIGITLVVDTVGERDAAKSIGFVAMASSVGLLAGPLLGGVLYEKGGYYTVFGVAFGLIGLDMVLRLVMIEKKSADKWRRIEARLLDASLGDGEKATELQEEEKLASVASVAEQPKYRRTQVVEAVLDSGGRILTNITANFALSMVMTSMDTVLPLYVEKTFGWSQGGQGLIFAPLVVPHVLSPVAGYCTDRWPNAVRYVVSGAFLSMVPALILLHLVTDDTLADKALLCVLLAVIGLCAAVSLPAIDAEAFLIVADIERRMPGIFGRGGASGTAFGATTIGFAAGALVGPIVSGHVVRHDGWGALGCLLSAIMSMSACSVFLSMGGSFLGRLCGPTNRVTHA